MQGDHLSNRFDDIPLDRQPSASARVRHAAAICLAWLSVSAAASEALLGARGFIDVWALRRDVQAVQALREVAYASQCANERTDPDCEERINPARLRHAPARARLNATWMPALLASVARGDLVAEVIWLQCRTDGRGTDANGHGEIARRPASGEAAC